MAETLATDSTGSLTSALLEAPALGHYRPPTPPRSLAEIFAELGHTLMAAQRTAEAIQAYRDAMEEDPRSAELYCYLGRAYQAQQRHNEALNAYLSAVKHDPRSAPVVLPRTRELLTPELAPGLLDWARRIAVARPDPEAAAAIDAFLLDLAAHLVQADEPQSAIELLDLTSNDQATAAARWRVHGDALLLLDDRAGALDCYREARSADPSDPELARRYAENLPPGDPGLADAWAALVALSPDDFDAQLRLAEALRGAGRLEEALASAERAAKLAGSTDSRCAPAFRLKGELLADLGREPAAVVEALFKSGRASYRQGDWPAAVEMLERVAALDTTHQLAAWYLAYAYFMLSSAERFPYDGEPIDKARAHWIRALKLGAPTAADRWVYQIGALICEQLYRRPPAPRFELWYEAAAYAERALAHDPDDITHLAFATRYYRYLMLEYASLQVAGRGQALGSGDALLLEEQAAIYTNTRQYQIALELLERRRASGTNEWLDAVKALILGATGDPEAALALLPPTTDNIWMRSLLAQFERRAGRPEQADAHYAAIWRSYDPTDHENLGNYAWAAYQLGHYPEAISLFLKMAGVSERERYSQVQNIGMAHLRRGDLQGGRRKLREGIELVINPWHLDQIEQDDLPELERFSGGQPHEAELRAAIADARGWVAARREQLDPGRGAADELRELLAATTGPASWAWVLAHAGLARIASAEGRWQEAVDHYRALLADERFPEARPALERLAEAILAAGTEAFAARRTADAAELWGLALSLGDLPEFALPQRRAELRSRIALVRLEAHDLQGALGEIRTALTRFAARDLGPPAAIAAAWRAMLRDPAHYWQVDAGLAELAAIAPPELRAPLASIRQALVAYLDLQFHLDADSWEQNASLPLITPISIEMSEDVLPSEGDPVKDWPLFTDYIPAMRARVEANFGVTLPGVRVRASTEVRPLMYRLRIEEMPLAVDFVRPGWAYTPAPLDQLAEVGLERRSLHPAPDPRSDLPGAWLPAALIAQGRAAGIEVGSDHLGYPIYHLEALLLCNLAEFLGVEEAELLLGKLSATPAGAALVAAALPEPPARLRFARLLRELVRERVPVTDLAALLELLKDVDHGSAEIAPLLRAARLRLRAQLPGLAAAGQAQAPPPTILERLRAGLYFAHGRSFLAMAPAEAKELMADVADFVEEIGPRSTVVLPTAELRLAFRRLTAEQYPWLNLLSAEEQSYAG